MKNISDDKINKVSTIFWFLCFKLWLVRNRISFLL